MVLIDKLGITKHNREIRYLAIVSTRTKTQIGNVGQLSSRTFNNVL